MFFHHPQGIEIFLASVNKAVALVIPHTINIMRPSRQKRIPPLYGRTACARFTACVRITPICTIHNRIKITNRLHQILSIALSIVILKQQLRNQHLAIMPLKHIQAVRRLTPRKLQHHLQRTIRLLPHQTINPLQSLVRQPFPL